MKQETKDFIYEVFTLALPAGLQQVINLAVNLIDSIMIGSLGESAITAVSVSSTYMWLCSTAVMAIASGAAIIMAQDYGRGNYKRIKQLLSFSLVISVVISLIFVFISGLFPVQIIKIYSNVESIIEPGKAYLKYIKYSIPLLSISTVIMVCLRAVRCVKLGLYNSLFSCITNVFFNWVFIFGHLGAPAMGVAGAAIGTVMARLIEVIVSVVYLLFIEKNLKFKISDFDMHIGMPLFKSFLKITYPILIMDVLASLLSSAQTMITGRISANYVSANSITHNAWTIPNVFCWGVGTAASIMIGNSLGKGDFEKAKRDSKRFLYASLGFGLFSASMVQIILPILLRFYNITEETKALATQLGYCASITVFFVAFNAIICNGVIKSGGHTKILLRIDMLSSWLIAIPLGYLCAFVFHMPAAVLYLVLRLGNILKPIWGVWYLKYGNWMHTIQIENKD